jgi:hypothetical protein
MSQKSDTNITRASRLKAIIDMLERPEFCLLSPHPDGYLLLSTPPGTTSSKFEYEAPKYGCNFLTYVDKTPVWRIY